MYAPVEDHFALVRERVRLRFAAGGDAPFHILSLDGSFPDQSLRLDDDGTSLVRLADTLAAAQPAVIALDPFRELHASKENDADAMSLLLRPLRQLAHETGTAIVLIHHRNKSIGGDASAAVRGSSAITGSVDVVMTMDVDGNEDDDLTPQKVVTLRAEGRYGPRQKIAARLGTGLRWETTAPPAPADEPLERRIRRHLALAPHPVAAEELADALGAARGSVQNCLTRLVTNHHAARLGKGAKSDPFRYVLPGCVTPANDAFPPTS